MLWVLVPIAFLSGSIPFGVLIARSRGVDIRAVGSGNPGASNVGRVLGRKFGLMCFALDLLKGAIPTLAGALIVRGSGGGLDAPAAWVLVAILAATVLGHMFSPWIGFKGGKGVATGLGALLGLWPHLTIPGLVAFGVWLVVLFATRLIGVASCVAAVALPVAVWLTRPSGEPWDVAAAFYVTTGLLAVLVVVRHRSNIARTIRGTEHKVDWVRPKRASHGESGGTAQSLRESSES